MSDSTGRVSPRDQAYAFNQSRLAHIGWRNVTTGKLWVVPIGKKPAEYDVGPEWKPIYARR